MSYQRSANLRLLALSFLVLALVIGMLSFTATWVHAKDGSGSGIQSGDSQSGGGQSGGGQDGGGKSKNKDGGDQGSGQDGGYNNLPEAPYASLLPLSLLVLTFLIYRRRTRMQR